MKLRTTTLISLMILTFFGTALIAGDLLTSTTPGAAAIDKQMHLVYPHLKDKSLQWVISDGKSWKNMGTISGRNGTFYSPTSPSLINYNGTLFMVYQGVNPKHGAFWARLDRGRWVDMGPILLKSPTGYLGGQLMIVDNFSATLHRGELYISYQGEKPANQVYWAKWNGREDRWVDLGMVKGVYTARSPGMISVKGQLTMVYRDVKTEAMKWAISDGRSWKHFPPIVGDHGPFMTPASPALFEKNDAVHMVYQGLNPKNGGFWARVNHNKWQDLYGINLKGGGQLMVVDDFATVTMNGVTYIFYQGQHPANTIYWAKLEGNQWIDLLRVTTGAAKY